MVCTVCRVVEELFMMIVGERESAMRGAAHTEELMYLDTGVKGLKAAHRVSVV